MNVPIRARNAKVPGRTAGVSVHPSTRQAEMTFAIDVVERAKSPVAIFPARQVGPFATRLPAREPMPLVRCRFAWLDPYRPGDCSRRGLLRDCSANLFGTRGVVLTALSGTPRARASVRECRSSRLGCPIPELWRDVGGDRSQFDHITIQVSDVGEWLARGMLSPSH